MVLKYYGLASRDPDSTGYSHLSTWRRETGGMGARGRVAVDSCFLFTKYLIIPICQIVHGISQFDILPTSKSGHTMSFTAMFKLCISSLIFVKLSYYPSPAEGEGGMVSVCPPGRPCVRPCVCRCNMRYGSIVDVPPLLPKKTTFVTVICFLASYVPSVYTEWKCS